MQDDPNSLCADPVVPAPSPQVHTAAALSRQLPKQPPKRRRRRLIAIATALVTAGIGAAVGLPRYFRARIYRNESAILATLRNISSAQSQLQASGAQDVDGNGHGEYGFFGELAGVAPLRGSGERLAPPVLTAHFGAVRDGRVEVSGYLLQIFLPSKDGGWVTESTCASGDSEVDTAAAEKLWMCYAWPIERGWTGNRAFMINQAGDILATSMAAEAYTGRIAPKGGVSGHCMDDGRCRPAANTMDRCGNRWVVV